MPAICRDMISSLMSKMEGLSCFNGDILDYWYSYLKPYFCVLSEIYQGFSSTNDAPFHERIIDSVNSIYLSVSTLRRAFKNDNGASQVGKHWYSSLV